MSDETQVSIRWADHPEVEKRLQALDNLDAAYDLLSSLDADACSDIHLARERVKVTLGAALFRIGRAAESAPAAVVPPESPEQPADG